MGRMKDLAIDIERMLIDGKSPDEIANLTGATMKDILAVEERFFFDDSGFDQESDADALASAGFGTNEDYGDFGGFDDSN